MTKMIRNRKCAQRGIHFSMKMDRHQLASNVVVWFNGVFGGVTALTFQQYIDKYIPNII
jgi:hypothetical protein